MADYYTKFSVTISLPTEEAQDYALDLFERVSELRDNEGDRTGLPAEVNDDGLIEGWAFQCETDGSSDGFGLWIHSVDGGMDGAMGFIQHLLAKFTPAEHIEFEWSNDCSKPRLDAFGGGAAFITAEKIEYMTTTEWLNTQRTAWDAAWAAKFTTTTKG